MSRYLTRQAQAVRYDKDVKTIIRWGQNPAMGMPPEIDLNGRKHREEDALIRWERSRIAKTAQSTALLPDPVK
jgi:hypothetical protein